MQDHPETPKNHRAIIKSLDEEKEEDYTFKLLDEKLLTVVLESIPVVIDKEFDARNIDRMYKKSQRWNIYMSLILVQLPSTEKSKNIYNLWNIHQMKIQVDAQKTKTLILQCHRCQDFGHNMARCKPNPWRVNCGQNHITNECTKLRNTKPKCANSGGPHPMNYSECISFSQTRTKWDKTTDQQPANTILSVRKVWVMPT